jgi:hypothetical protein
MPDTRYMYHPEGYRATSTSPNPGAFYPRAAEEHPRERYEQQQQQQQQHHYHHQQSHSDGHGARAGPYPYQRRSPSRDGRHDMGHHPGSRPSPQPQHAAPSLQHQDARNRPFHPHSPAGPHPKEEREGSADASFRLPPIAMALGGQSRPMEEDPRAMYGDSSREDGERGREAEAAMARDRAAEWAYHERSRQH